MDISESGMGLLPDHALELKMPVLLSIAFSDKKSMSVRGRVVSVIPKGPQKGVGVEFLSESTEQRNELADQVALLKSKRSK